MTNPSRHPDPRTTRKIGIDISERLKLLRYRMHWTQADLASNLGVSEWTIRKHEARDPKHKMNKRTLRRFEILEQRLIDGK